MDKIEVAIMDAKVKKHVEEMPYRENALLKAENEHLKRLLYWVVHKEEKKAVNVSFLSYHSLTVGDLQQKIGINEAKGTSCFVVYVCD